MTMKMTDILLDSFQAANWLSLSTSTLAKLRLTGKGPVYVKLGRRVAYRNDDLEAWVELHRVRSTSEYGAGSRSK
jgi:predicted DNA-binding transcriptional regulator AlpA